VRQLARKGLVMSRQIWLGSLVLVVCASATPFASADELADKARTILEERCGGCHGKVNPQSDLNVLDHSYLMENGYLTAGKLDESELWARVSASDQDLVMPPGQPMPADEIAIIQQWIDAGALAPSEGVLRRPFVSTGDIFAAVAADLRSFPEEDYDRLRYFSITHLHNNATVSDEDLQVYRAALSKLINSLSWEPDIYLPVPIEGTLGTVLRVDLVRIGWDKHNQWQRMLTDYPYGMSYDTAQNEQLQRDASFVYDATLSRIPVVRADWFVARAGVPPLYHDLLQLPDGPNTAAEIEKMLQVDVIRDFEQNLLARAGFIKSNVSQHNRLVDRHPAAYGAYWKSYDFGSSAGINSLTLNPLGPAFPGNRHDRVAFQHDGGELIFNLPNGLQGYLLVDGKGGRIDRGPINVVYDSKSPLGNREVINGISCMVCHVHGMQPFVDDIRSGHGVQGVDAIKVERLYLPQEQMNQLLDKDRIRFLTSLDEATGPFLRAEGDQTPITEFREPVGAIARQFTENLTFEDVASETGFEDHAALRILFNTPQYRKFGLGVLVDDKVISRDMWEKLDPYSIFQATAEQLGFGTPERVFSSD
ncbi:MAG: hypothetical protein KDA52_05305, partial [Planctomycetaceae bacterium]|nr:hypothetical protein [Planctomycetaceae bacterium]